MITRLCLAQALEWRSSFNLHAHCARVPAFNLLRTHEKLNQS